MGNDLGQVECILDPLDASVSVLISKVMVLLLLIPPIGCGFLSVFGPWT